MEDVLIAEIQSRPFLYNRRLKSYRDKDLRNAAWFEIADAVGEDREICQRRWKSLRDKFVKELNNTRRSTSEEWSFMKRLNFLRTHVESRTPSRSFGRSEFVEVYCDSEESERTLETPIETFVETIEVPVETSNEFYAENVERDFSSCSKPKKIKKEVIEENMAQLQKVIGMANDFLQIRQEQVVKPKEEEETKVTGRNDTFYKVVESYLSKVSPEKQDSIKMEMLSLVFEKTMQKRK